MHVCRTYGTLQLDVECGSIHVLQASRSLELTIYKKKSESRPVQSSLLDWLKSFNLRKESWVGSFAGGMVDISAGVVAESSWCMSVVNMGTL